MQEIGALMCSSRCGWGKGRPVTCLMCSSRRGWGQGRPATSGCCEPSNPAGASICCSVVDRLCLNLLLGVNGDGVGRRRCRDRKCKRWRGSRCLWIFVGAGVLALPRIRRTTFGHRGSGVPSGRRGVSKGRDADEELQAYKVKMTNEDEDEEVSPAVIVVGLSGHRRHGLEVVNE
ncbi:hypothetical protein GUJ93_ZPchr0014g47020 [Zizania palustris]|uniref:Uncharacterized protein n=1 Tax=Zizania palustris TaxID=103762 RepID=A0A8J5TKP4_ZIZPA|nr:hypothetical protein GUJ93_ZPchr0014g47020 [Zizania palustris]